MALELLETNIVLDVYDHDGTRPSIKSIALDDNTRYVFARLTYQGETYDIGSDATVELIIIRPDKVGAQIVGESKAIQMGQADESIVTVYGAYAELDQPAIAVAGTLLGQFVITSGDQILRSQIFAVNNGEALDADEWAGQYDGYNLDELVEMVDETVDRVDDLEEDVAELKSGLSDMINSAYVTDSASGSVAHFEDGADDVPVKSLKVNIEPVQSGSGDPSPSNIRPITGWDSIEVTRCGKNLCKLTNFTGTFSGVTYTIADGVVTVDGTATANVYRGAIDIPLKAGTYTVANLGDADTAEAYVLVSDTSTNPSSWITLANLSNGSPVTFTLDHDIVAAVRVVVRNGKTVSNMTFKPMLVYGSDAPTEFEPYNGNTYNISLSSVGTVYGGSLDVVSGAMTVTHGYIASYAGETLPSTWISDRDVYADGTTPTTGAEVVYELATPTTVQLTGRQIKSLLGINNIWADAGDVEVEYRANTKLYIDKRLAEVTA